MVDLMAGIAVLDYDRALAWYEKRPEGNEIGIGGRPA